VIADTASGTASGQIIGTVTLDGCASKFEAIYVATEASCAQIHRGTQRPTSVWG